MASQALPALAEGQAAPDWVHLLPAPADGKIGTTDSRGPYLVADAAALIAASFAHTARLPIDENHSTDLAAPRGEPAPARGWIIGMEARPDGIWGQVEWNAAGSDLVIGKAYRAISPVILHDAAKNIHSILRAGLVNRPNIRGLTALHQQETDMNPSQMQELARKLGLAEDATFEAILAAIGGKASDTAMQSALTEVGVALGVAHGAEVAAIVAAAKSAKTATPAAITALQSEIADLTTQLNGVTEAQKRTAAEAFVDAQVKRGNYSAKALKDHYVAMHMADPVRVEKELGAMPVLTASGTSIIPPAPKDGTVSLNAEQLAVAKMLGISPKDFAADVAAEQEETN